MMGWRQRLGWQSSIHGYRIGTLQLHQLLWNLEMFDLDAMRARKKASRAKLMVSPDFGADDHDEPANQFARFPQPACWHAKTAGRLGPSRNWW